MYVLIEFEIHDDGLLDSKHIFYRVKTVNQFYQYLIKNYHDRVEDSDNKISKPGIDDPDFEEYINQCIDYYLQMKKISANELTVTLIKKIIKKPMKYYSDEYDWSMKIINTKSAIDITSVD